MGDDEPKTETPKEQTVQKEVAETCTPNGNITLEVSTSIKNGIETTTTIERNGTCVEKSIKTRELF